MTAAAGQQLGREREKALGRSTPMAFILTGFKQDLGFRVFGFERVVDHVRTQFTVRVDLTLSQRHGIRLQDLPLVCRGILERSNAGEETLAVTFTEDEMRVYARDCAVAREAGQKRRPPRRPAS